MSTETPQPQPTYPDPPVLPAHPKTSTAFVLSLIGLILFTPLGIISFVQVRRIRREMAANPGRWRDDDGQLKAAWVLSIIDVVLCVLLVIWVIAAIVLFSSGASTVS